MEQCTGVLIGQLESDKRLYVCKPEILENYVKRFNMRTEDERLLEFAKDRALGAYSDCYILYAVAYMGACSLEAIHAFLYGLSVRYPHLSIVRERKDLELRIRALRNMGLLFVFSYDIEAVDEVTRIKDVQKISLVTTTENGYHVARQRLKLPNLMINNGFQYKSFDEIIGWASTAFVASRVLLGSYFHELTERRLGTKQITAFLPFEMKTKLDGNTCYVGFVDGFFHRNDMIQDEKAYIYDCLRKMDIIRNYLNARTSKDMSCVVVVVESREDLYEVGKFVARTHVLTEDQNICRIFFTGEGLIRECGENIARAFLRLQLSDQEECGYQFVAVTPLFVRE